MEDLKENSKMKIGIYGGTFNPIHYGHLINVELVREQYKLDKVLLIPVKIPVHKKITCSVSPMDRFQMICESIKDNDYLEVSRIELDRTSPSYTVLTLELIKKEFPNSELFLIMGSDSFHTIESWNNYEKIIKDHNLIVMSRSSSDHLIKNEVDAATVDFFNNPQIEISSTMIRKRIKTNKTIKYLTPDSVINYIKSKELYQN